MERLNAIEKIYDSINEEVNEMYPEMTQAEMTDLIYKALEQKSIQEMIVNYICYQQQVQQQ